MHAATKLSKTFIVLIPGFPADEADTTCLPAQQLLIKEINKVCPSLEVIILAFEYPFHTKQYSWYGNRVIPVNGRNKNRVAKLILWLNVLVKLRRLRKQKNVVGVFSCWCTECALVGKYFAKLNKLPHFIWVCGQDARAGNKMVKRINPQPGELLAISNSIQQEFHKNHKIKPTYIIENGIDANMFIPTTTERTIDILGVGSLISLKQFEIFIEVIAGLKKIKPGIKAVLCGKGPEKDKLLSQIEALQLENTITLTGEKPHEEILQYMQQSKILLHPSSYEGFSGACLEALYAGAHVVSFCHAVERPVSHWHIVADKTEMYQRALDILDDTHIDHSPFLVNHMSTSAKKLMQLYNIGS